MNTSKIIIKLFSDLLERIYENMRKNNPLLTKKSKTSISMPQVGPLGTKKSWWGNFEEVIRSLDRKLEHAQLYFAAELGAENNLNEKNQLVFKGRFNQKTNRKNSQELLERIC